MVLGYPEIYTHNSDHDIKTTLICTLGKHKFNIIRKPIPSRIDFYRFHYISIKMKLPESKHKSLLKLVICPDCHNLVDGDKLV